MLHELDIGGLLFSPLVVFIPLAFVLTWATRWVLHSFNLRQFLWKEAWFNVGLFVCYLTGILFVVTL